MLISQVNKFINSMGNSKLFDTIVANGDIVLSDEHTITVQVNKYGWKDIAVLVKLEDDSIITLETLANPFGKGYDLIDSRGCEYKDVEEQDAWITGKLLSHKQVESFVTNRVFGTGPLSCISSPENYTEADFGPQDPYYVQDGNDIPDEDDYSTNRQTTLTAWYAEESNKYKRKQRNLAYLATKMYQLENDTREDLIKTIIKLEDELNKAYYRD